MSYYASTQMDFLNSILMSKLNSIDVTFNLDTYISKQTI